MVGVIASEQAARDYGYNTTFVAESRTVLDDYQDSLPAAEQLKFDEAIFGPDDAPTEQYIDANERVWGKSAVGCMAEADRAIYGSVATAMSLELFTNDVTAQISKYQGDIGVAVQQLMPAYEGCMAEAGYQVRGLNAPQVAFEQFGSYRETGQRPSSDEQNLAVADYRCQAAVGLAEKLNTLFVEKASMWLSTNSDRILGLQEALQAALKRAKDVIDG